MKNTPVNATTGRFINIYLNKIKKKCKIKSSLIVYTPYVVINEPKVFRQVDWSTGMCDIFDDCSDCCCAFFCTSCFLYKLYSRAGEGFCSCLFVSLSQLRTKVRIERGIHVISN